MIPAILAPLLVCPRCRGAFVETDRLRCAACGAEFPVRDDIPRLSDGAEERDERMAAEFEAQGHAHAIYVDPTYIMNDWEREVLPRLADWIDDASGPSGPILDIGCGVGKLGAALTSLGRSKGNLVGTDFHGKLLEEVRTGYAGLVEADVHRLPFKDGAFAAAITTNALHHFPEPTVAMVEIARVLQPGGTLVTYDPRFITPLEMLKKALRKNDTAFTKDHKAFRVEEYRELLGSSGLVVSDVQTVDALGPLVATGLDYLKIGRFGVALPIARALAMVDRAIGSTPFGLMLAARAVKPSQRP
jgi:demethylmenaquinone methyltransferase/2-methoxy-6-polyprenyl-1,4-benzoquinol methylase